MEPADPERIVIRFNERVNAGDLIGLVERMTDDHTLVAGSEVRGREDCTRAWREFFATFPDYRNHFDQIVVRDESVIILGRSTCSDPRLQGPAIWAARTRDGLVSEWRVYEDTPENRAKVDLKGVDAPPG